MVPLVLSSSETPPSKVPLGRGAGDTHGAWSSLPRAEEQLGDAIGRSFSAGPGTPDPVLLGGCSPRKRESSAATEPELLAARGCRLQLRLVATNNEAGLEALDRCGTLGSCLRPRTLRDAPSEPSGAAVVARTGTKQTTGPGWGGGRLGSQPPQPGDVAVFELRV